MQSTVTVNAVPANVASLSQSLAVGDGLLLATADNVATFTVQLRDKFGNNLVSPPSASWYTTLRLADLSSSKSCDLSLSL